MTQQSLAAEKTLVYRTNSNKNIANLLMQINNVRGVRNGY